MQRIQRKRVIQEKRKIRNFITRLEKNVFLVIVGKHVRNAITKTPLRTHFLYILIGLVFFIIYELYLIGFYKYQDFQINNHVASLNTTNSAIEKRNDKKDLLNTYIRTKAYQSMVAKATQNKKLPGEEVINIVEESDVEGNAPIDVRQVIYDVRKSEDSPMKGMSNPEKWWYIITHLREMSV